MLTHTTHLIPSLVFPGARVCPNFNCVFLIWFIRLIIVCYFTFSSENLLCKFYSLRPSRCWAYSIFAFSLKWALSFVWENLNHFLHWMLCDGLVEIASVILEEKFKKVKSFVVGGQKRIAIGLLNDSRPKQFLIKPGIKFNAAQRGSYILLVHSSHIYYKYGLLWLPYWDLEITPFNYELLMWLIKGGYFLLIDIWFQPDIRYY